MIAGLPSTSVGVTARFPGRAEYLENEDEDLADAGCRICCLHAVMVASVLRRSPIVVRSSGNVGQ